MIEDEIIESSAPETPSTVPDRRDGAEGAQPSVAEGRLTVLFVGGMARGGTTLLAELLTARPEVALMIEYDFLVFLRHLSPVLNYHRIVHATALPIQTDRPEADGQEADGSARPEAAAIPHFPIRENPAAARRRRYPTPDRLPRIAQAAVAAALEKPGATIIGCKSPYFYVDHHDRPLACVFDDVRYIFVIRRPTGQINSSLNRGNRSKLDLDRWPIQTVRDAIEEYRYFLRVAISFARRTDKACLHVKYEDIVGRGREELARVGRFLDLDDLGDTEDLIGPEADRSVLTRRDAADVEDAFGALEQAWADLATDDRAALADTLSIGLAPIGEGTTSYLGGSAKDHLGAGWSTPDTEGVWSSAERADLVFAGEGEWVIVATVVPYLPTDTSLLDVSMAWNDAPIGRLVFVNSSAVEAVCHGNAETRLIGMRDRTRHAIHIGPVRLDPEQANVLSFRIDGAVPPSVSGYGADDRLVGVKLLELRFLRLSTSGPA